MPEEPSDHPAVPSNEAGSGVAPAPIPRSFAEYLRAMGPGIVVVLTWLGAGDIVDASVAGGSYGYALMWVLALALIVRWLFVSNIARYQLCNTRSESVMEGLARLCPLFPPFIFLSTILLSHIVGAYMYQGLGESFSALVRWGSPSLWAIIWAVLFYVLLFRPVYKRIERVFMVFLGLLAVSLIGAALWAGPDPLEILKGTIGFALPERRGAFHAETIGVSLVGAVAGSLANLMYPYFIRDKGWNTPAHLKVQRYDLALGIAVIIVLDLSVWVLGAEVLHPRSGVHIATMHDIARILGGLGRAGVTLFYVGVFAAVGSSVVGNALAYSYMATDAFLLWRPRAGNARGDGAEYRLHPGYRWMVLWCLFSPLPWILSGKTSFVALTVGVNAFQVVLLPVLATGMWILTASGRFIGPKQRNGLWENLGMGLFTAVALLGAAGAIQSLVKALLPQ